MTKNGIHDLPIGTREEDTFGIEPYVGALSHFIKDSETPITVALQGGWGTGKTSFINLTIKKLDELNLVPNEENHYISVFFNTWQYSQFNLQENLGISFLSYMIDKLSEGIENSKEIREKAKVVITSLAAIGINIALARLGTQLPESKAEKNDLVDPAKAIEELKNTLKEIVSHKLDNKTGKNTKLVIFIDDLDRLNPIVTVNLLEIIKLFLDIEGCIFVLAVDNKVIQEGIKASKNTSDEKTKSFLDKMIQVPFKLPIETYNYNSFLNTNIDWFSIDELTSDVPISQLEELIRYSVGSNPRGMKRLINNYLLNRHINALLNDTLVKPARTLNRSDVREEMLLLAVICIQLSFQPLYITIVNMDEEDLTKLLNLEPMQTNETIEESLLNLLSKNRFSDLYEDDYNNDIGRYTIFLELLNEFLSDLYNLENTNKISAAQLHEFITVMKRAQLTSGVEETTKNVRRKGTGVTHQFNINDFVDGKKEIMKKFILARNPINYAQAKGEVKNPLKPMMAFKNIVQDLFEEQNKFDELIEEINREVNGENSGKLNDFPKNVKKGFYYGKASGNPKEIRQVIIEVPVENSEEKKDEDKLIVAIGHHLSGMDSIELLKKLLDTFEIQYDPNKIMITTEEVKK